MKAPNADRDYMLRAIQLALDAERIGNLPIGAVITLNGEVIAEAGSSLLVPYYHPGHHAETEALRNVQDELWIHSRKMTCYTTLEPCVMCLGALLLHGIGRVVFGATDKRGGSGDLLNHLPEYYADGVGVPDWVGPLMPEECDPLYERVTHRFDRLPIIGRLRLSE